MADRPMFKRRILETALQGMGSFPVVMLQGPRTVGKTTLLEEIARSFGGAVVDLDHPGVRSTVESALDSVVAGPKPVFIDEYQKIPEMLDYIKAQLNRDGSPGQFVLTGSSRHDALPRGAQALTGRLLRLPVLPLSQAEISGAEGNFVETVFDGLELPGYADASETARDGYAERVITGGFPLQVHSRDERERRGSIEQYLRLSIEVDARELLRIRRPDALSHFLQRLAAQTGQVLNMTKAGGDVGVKSSTAENYTKLLEALFIMRRLPMWRKTDRGPVRRPKIYAVDSGVAAHLLGFSAERLRSGEPFMSEQFGHLLETFVVGEIWKMVSWAGGARTYKVGYWKDRNGAEVDLVVEHPDDGSVVAVEVKAAQQVRSGDAKAMRRLRDELGPRFRRGVVLHTGPHAHRLDDGIYAAPIDMMWQGAAEAPVPARRPRRRREEVRLPEGGRTAESPDHVPAPVHAAAAAMMELLNPGESAYWEIAVTASEPVEFDDFYSSAGILGALIDLQAEYPGRRVYGLAHQGTVQAIDECLALTDAGRGILIHPAGTIVAVALGMDAEGRNFLGWPIGSGSYLEARQSVLSQWPLEIAVFVHQHLRPHISPAELTYWSLGRRLQTGRPSLLLGAGQDPPASLTAAVVDNPYRKQLPSTGDPEIDAYNLKASFYEWFGIPATALPEAGQGRITLSSLSG